MELSSNHDITAEDIEHLLRILGASPVYAGFIPTITAIEFILENPRLMSSLTTRLYPKVAESCGTTLPSVERNIRTLISVIWEKNRFLFEILAGYGMSARPSVGDFLAILSTYLMYHPASEWPEYLQ